jgi:hypothetical protein
MKPLEAMARAILLAQGYEFSGESLLDAAHENPRVANE